MFCCLDAPYQCYKDQPTHNSPLHYSYQPNTVTLQHSQLTSVCLWMFPVCLQVLRHSFIQKLILKDSKIISKKSINHFGTLVFAQFFAQRLTFRSTSHLRVISTPPPLIEPVNNSHSTPQTPMASYDSCNQLKSCNDSHRMIDGRKHFLISLITYCVAGCLVGKWMSLHRHTFCIHGVAEHTLPGTYCTCTSVAHQMIH